MTIAPFVPRFGLVTDVVVLALAENARLCVALIRRRKDPYMGEWALPGGKVEVGERVEIAARRELHEEVNLDAKVCQVFTQLGVFDDPKRDPRGRVVSVAYVGLVQGLPGLRAGSDASYASWHDVVAITTEVPNAPRLAFDHLEIVQAALAWYRQGKAG